MTGKSYPISQPYKPSVSDHFFLAHARRDSNPAVDNSGPKTSGSIGLPLDNKNHLCSQGVGGKRKSNHLHQSAAFQRRIHHPLNMIVSEIATRETHKENNFHPSKGFDSTVIRNSKLLQPSWKEKEMSRKKIQHAHLYNKRKIEEIQAMKAKLKCPQYDPDELLSKCRCHDQESLSESNYSPRTDPSPERRNPLCGNAWGPPQSENSVQDDFLRDNQTSRWSLNDEENFPISFKPNFHRYRDKFVWNPVIQPSPNSFSSVTELLEYHYGSDKNNLKEWIGSPGKHTTSSTSSGLTVAEETVKLTYYESDRLHKQNQSERANQRFLYRPSGASVDEWCPSNLSGTGNCFEE